MLLSGRRYLLLISFLIIALLLIGSGTGMAEEKVGPSPEMVAKGKELFLRSCSACHGPDARGLPHLGKNLRASTFVKGLNDEELLAFVKRGRPSFDPANTTHVDMPPKGGNPALTDEQLKAIIAYIRSIAE